MCYYDVIMCNCLAYKSVQTKDQSSNTILPLKKQQIPDSDIVMNPLSVVLLFYHNYVRYFAKDGILLI